VSAPQKVLGSLFALLVAVIMLGSFTPGPALGRSPLPPWVTLSPAADCSAGCWRIVAAEYDNEHESGGNHNIYGRMTVNGESPAGLPWHVAWPDGDVRILTKPAPEWADFPIFDCFNPDNETGAYFAYAGDNPAQSDIARGMGLPQCLHVNYWFVWQWSAGGPTVTPTATPTPSHWLYLPIIDK
jgi:hypothetical protein